MAGAERPRPGPGAGAERPRPGPGAPPRPLPARRPPPSAWWLQSAGLCSPLTQRPRIGPLSTNAACRRDGAPTGARSMNRPSPPTSPSSTTPGHAARSGLPKIRYQTRRGGRCIAMPVCNPADGSDTVNALYPSSLARVIKELRPSPGRSPACAGSGQAVMLKCDNSTALRNRP